MALHSDTEEKRVPFLREGCRQENGAGAGARAKSSSLLFRSASRTKQQNGEQVQGPLPGSAPGLLRADSAAAPSQFAAESEECGATAVQKTAEDLARKSFQIPKKNKEKKELCQLVPVGPREFKQDILKILNSSYLESSSSANFTYMKARLVHNERLEKEYMEKRKEMRNEGRTEKELAESYAFLLLETSQVPTICEKGLSVGNSKVTILGNPAMGIYLSKYCDVLQQNPLDNGRKAEIIIFKILKGRVKAVIDNTTKNFTPPTPKHDCHVFRNINRVISLFTYRAFDLTQFYLYEFGNEGIRQCPRQVCPYAVVSFIYMENKIPKISKPVTLSLEENHAGKSYTIWKGQLMNKGRFLCLGSLQSTSQPFLPFKLPEKLEIHTVMSIDCLKNKIPVTVFRKTTFSGTREVLKNGLYCSLYELVDQSKMGRNLEPLLHKLEEEKLVLVKPLDDRGFLLLFSPLEMVDNESQSSKPKFLQALFLFPESRLNEDMKRNTKPLPTVHNDPEAIPQLSKIIPALHYALEKIRKELPCSLKQATIDAAFKNNVIDYLKNSLSKEAFAEFIIPTYEEKRFSSVFRQKRSNVPRIMRSYFFYPHRYQFDVSEAGEMLNQHQASDMEVHDHPEYVGGEQAFDDPVSEITTQEPENPQIENIVSDSNFLMPSDNLADYDPDKIQELIDLIYSRKRLGPGEASLMNIERLAHCISDKDDLGLKRKLEFVSEQSHKQMKITEGSLQENVSKLSDIVPQMMNGLVFGDTDLRTDQATTLAPDTQKLVGLLCEVLKSSSCQNTGTDFQLNQEGKPSSVDLQQNNVDYYWDQSNISVEEASKLNQQSIDGPLPQNEATKEELSHKETILGVEEETLGLGDKGSSLPHDNYRIKTNDQPSGEHCLQSGSKAEYPESMENINSPEGCSPCTNTSHDQLYSKRITTSDCTIGEINWKLIPITDMKSRIEQLFYLPPEDSCPDDPRVINRKSNINHYQPSSDSDIGVGGILKEYSKDFHHSVATYGTNGHLFDLKDDPASAIENAVKLEYNKFSDKLKQLLKREKVQYSSDNKRLMFSAAQKVSMLSKYSNTQLQPVPVQSYIRHLRKRMNSIISDSCSDVSCTNFHPCPSSPSPELAHGAQRKIAVCSEVVQPITDSKRKACVSITEESNQCIKMYEEPILCENTRWSEKIPESDTPLAENIEQLQRTPQQNNFTFGLVTDSNSTVTVGEDACLILDQTPSFESQQETSPLKEFSGIGGLPEPQPCLTNLIQKLNPEVFCNLVEIIKDVQKNTVKFYIYEAEKTSVCAEIKEYLTGLGNKECHPKEFLKRKASSVDKLLIIIQNEDIALHVQKVPFLTSLKKLSRVSFAGVDSLDDVQNHTYNELFVSGGFVVSDETVLNPECITVEKLQIFLEFLKDLSTPESKWVWKVHCKMHKKLKELARTNAAAFNILSLLNKYQKNNLVEILSYHDCDSRARNTIELDCLIKLQAQTIQQRHVVFLTEKSLELFSSYPECGVVRTCVGDFVKNFTNIIGYHSSSKEDKQPVRLGSQDSLQGTFSFNTLELAEVENADAEGNYEEEDMSLDSEDNSPQIEICSEKSEALHVSKISQTEVQRTKGKTSHSDESILQAPEDLQSTPSGDATSKLTTTDTPATSLQLVKEDSINLKGGAGFAYNNSSFHSYSQLESNYRNFNVITHQSFLTSGIEQLYASSPNMNWQYTDGYYSPGYDQNLIYSKSLENSWNTNDTPSQSCQQQQQK
ncbi:protein TASOR-like isoform X2 [Narcine bancroftii]|uniref:protein TASOR-like isoform X2 n=1 Tax=Narcine bancroftii TaxID=1343680 RepID=UPI0038319887